MENSCRDLESSSNSLGNYVHSPDLFSDDEDSCGDTPFSVPPYLGPPKLDIGLPPDEVFKHELQRFHRLQELLQGVPPPPSVTIPQITAAQVLRLWKENSSLVDGARKKALEAGEDLSWKESLSKPNSSLEQVLETNWPQVKSCLYHDVHYNISSASEEIERLSLKICERYVGSETSTWCNVFASAPGSAKKRQRTRGLSNTSPGCRLSHLARRRHTFSSANIAQLSSVAGSGKAGGATGSVPGGPSAPRRLLLGGPAGSQERRRIMVEIKKTDKNKRIKTNSKQKDGTSVTAPLRRSARKSQCWAGPQVVENPAQTTKRALFQSPPEEQKLASSTSRPSTTNVQNKVLRSKRALWPEGQGPFNENGKRSLDVDETEGVQSRKIQCSQDRVPHSRTARSLPFPLGRSELDSSAGSSSDKANATSGALDVNKSRRASDQGPSSFKISAHTELSELHKRKLFWAVSQALRNEGVSSRNSEFRPCASVLVQHYLQVRQDWKGPPPTSTSEHMLQVVAAKVHEVVAAHRAAQAGQEENIVAGGSIPLKREERPNKELFKDATASLNVRRSLNVPLSSSSYTARDSKLQQKTRRVPSARKSLSFDGFGPKGPSNRPTPDDVEAQMKLESEFKNKTVDPDKRPNGGIGISIPPLGAKRVSRSLFLSPKEESKTISKKDAGEQTSNEFTSDKKETECAGENSENSKSNCLSKSRDSDLLREPSPRSSSVSDCVLEADSESSCCAVNKTEQENSTGVPICAAAVKNISTHLNTEQPAPDEIEHRSIKCEAFVKTDLTSTDPLKQELIAQASTDTSTGSDEPNSCSTVASSAIKQKSARSLQPQPAPLLRRITRRSLSLAKSRSASTESAEMPHLESPFSRRSSNTGSENNVADSNSCGIISKDGAEKENSVGPGPSKGEPSLMTVESNTTLNGVFGSPPFLINETDSLQNSPFLGFQTTDETFTSGGTLSLVVDGSNSVIKVPVCGEGSSWLDRAVTPKEKSLKNVNEDSQGYVESKVITPLLEAAAIESSVCVGNGSSSSINTDLTFRGRIESLKPSADIENDIDLKLSMNISANILSMEESKEKGPDLEKWAERASRSAMKEPLQEDSNTSESCSKKECVSAEASKQGTVVDESMPPWEEHSQLDASSQCSTKLFEVYRSIFDPSSREGSS